MFKTMGLQVRRDGLSHAQYVDHWLHVHAPMCEGVDGLAGYVANEVILAGGDVGVPATHPAFGATLDGVAQLHFATRDGLVRMAEAPRVQAWFADGPNFVGLRTGFLVEEHVSRSPGHGDARGPIKAILFLAGDTGGLAARLDRLALGEPAGLVRSRVDTVTGSTNLPGFAVPPVDWVVELWGVDIDGAIAAARRIAGGIAGEGTVVSVLIARERVIRQPPQ